jgi:YidC/Oxa1 family membrane protein insertase
MFTPIFTALAWLVSAAYAVIPNYGIAIALMTVAVMAVLTPLTWKSTRSMLEMQRLQPEIRKLQQLHRNDRQRLNEEMMAFYREHRVNPLGGCLPMFLQMPVLFIMYRVIHGLAPGRGATPHYISHSSRLFRDLVADHGKMEAFGMDLAKSARSIFSDRASFFTVLPFIVLIALVVVTQYVQTKQMSGRTPASQQNPQMQMMQRIMPAFFGFISYTIPAGVNVYFLVSALFRIGQQSTMYRYDPVLKQHVQQDIREIEAKAYDAKSFVPKNTGTKNGGAKKPKGGAQRANARRPKKGR